ncbi:MAG: hypothetical protein DSM107014_07340 [Gomphosphaeria aponina SAG 52.96 = DSM 107014]|uniref:Uncharacterized protein n=1 Tax=Gomphosphaeria aponina SAG 52.96 = DSM 107014 TaxID=1521640 RepID=A0A941GXN6_9CHRO|nr:hypothetical protein [Gomphosphaeria aponina SAG 52.96 = DSM 107014]
MQLFQVVRINEAGLVANAVDFGMMADKEKNLRLCKGFVFNYNKSNYKASTLGILDAVWKSYGEEKVSNIHLMVQDYGKGKSHFALTLANFFKQPEDSPEVKGILTQMEIAVGNNQAMVGKIREEKQVKKRHLVICLSGDRSLDLRQIFLRGVRNTLEEEGITESNVIEICKKPLEYLESLSEEEQAIANEFLKQTESTWENVATLIEFLKQDNYRVIRTVKDISRQLNKGFAIDFETDLNIEEILENLIKNLCAGENPAYQGVLILFDELNYYLQSWANDSVAAGGAALQSITKACENHQGKMALVCFTQIRPLKSVPSKSAEDYKKLASRLEMAQSTYEPVSSLELVINGLIEQQVNTKEWQEFIGKWGSTLLADSRNGQEKRIPTYKERGWSLESFHQIITLGCFPLHPLNAYLLCNLDFTQGRTAIQYIQEEVKRFIEVEPVEKNGSLNYLAAVGLVTAFESNFGQFASYLEYERASDAIAASAKPEEITVLKALFLYYASKNKLNKLEGEKHEILLSELSGFSIGQTEAIIKELCNKRQVIYHNPGDNTYRFYGGINLQELREELEEELEKRNEHLTVTKVVNYCQLNVEAYLREPVIRANYFIEENKLLSDEWFFEYKFYAAEGITKILAGSQKLITQAEEAQGIFAYVLAETKSELEELKKNMGKILENSRLKERIVVAIPAKPTGEIARDLAVINLLTKRSTQEKQESGAASSQLRKQLEQKIEREIREIINSCTYYCWGREEIPLSERENPSRLVSNLLQKLYHLVPPVAKNEKMAKGKATGSKVIGYIANRLLEDDLTIQKFPDQSYNNLITPVFVEGWGLLKVTEQKYLVQIPGQKNVRAAWDKISEMTALGDKQEQRVDLEKIWQILAAPPFGYNEYTFTMLLTAWLAYHRNEVQLEGSFGIPQKKTQLVSVYVKPLKDWATTNVFSKPKDFISKWIEGGRKPRLIRRLPVTCPEVPKQVNYQEAEQLIKGIKNYLESENPDPVKVKEIELKREQLITGMKKVEGKLQPLEIAENLATETKLDILVEIYPRLRQHWVMETSSDLINVSPTEEQLSRQTRALGNVQEKIEQRVKLLREGAELLETEEEYGGYKVELEKAIEKIREVEGLPLKLIDILENAITTADERLSKLKTQAKIEQCLEQIQMRYHALSENASQQDYWLTLSAIETLAGGIPAVKEEQRYKEIQKELAQKQDDLTSLLENWSARLVGIARSKGLELYQEVSSQQNRFTKEESRKRVEQLLAQLNGMILEGRSESKVEPEKREQDEQIMQMIRQKNPATLESIRLCEEEIGEIANLRRRLNEPEVYKIEIEGKLQELKNKITEYNRQLQNIRDRLRVVANSRELNTLITEYSRLDLAFQDSPSYFVYQQLREEIRSLAGFFQVAEVPKVDTVEGIQAQLTRLNQWQHSVNNLSPSLQTRCEFLRNELEQKIEQLGDAKQEQAKVWLELMQRQAAQLEELAAQEKLRCANKILQELELEGRVYGEMLQAEEQELLVDIQQQCVALQSQNKEEQIIFLFQELSQKQRGSLYNKLKGYVSES